MFNPMRYLGATPESPDNRRVDAHLCRRTTRLVLMSALLLSASATPLAAETLQTVQPIDIEADRFTVYLADEKAIWQGDVVASQGNYTFRTSVLTLHLEQLADRTASEPDDNGSGANNTRPPFSLTARSVKYDLDQGTVSGQGNSELRRGEEVLRADKITYQVADQVAYGVPEAHGRVSVKFYGNPKRPVIPGALGIASRGAE